MDFVSQAGSNSNDQGTDSSAVSEELSRRIRNGDSTAETQLIKHLQPGLRMMISRHVGGDKGLVEDLVQETLLVVLKRLRGIGLEDPSLLVGFAARTARNLIIGVHRKNDRRRTDGDNEVLDLVPAPEPDLEDQAADDAAIAAVRGMLDELPQQRDRELLQRFYLQDDDKETLCREYGMSEGALNQALSRARTRFREILDRHGLQKADFIEVRQ